MRSNKLIAGMGGAGTGQDNAANPETKTRRPDGDGGGDFEASLVGEVQSKLDRLHHGNDKLRGAIELADRKEQPNFLQPPMKFTGQGPDNSRPASGTRSRKSGASSRQGPLRRGGAAGRGRLGAATTSAGSAAQAQYQAGLHNSQRKYLLNKSKQSGGP